MTLLLDQLIEADVSLILVDFYRKDLPELINQINLMDGGELLLSAKKQNILNHPALPSLLHLNNQNSNNPIKYY